MDDLPHGVVEGTTAEDEFTGVSAAPANAFATKPLSIAHQRTEPRHTDIADRDKYAKTANVWRFVIRGEAYFPQEVPEDEDVIKSMVDLVFVGHQSAELPVVEYEYVEDQD